MDDLKATAENLLKTYTNTANDPSVKNRLSDFKSALLNSDAKNKIKEILPSLIPSLTSSIGLSETATETSLILITYILSNNLIDDHLCKTIEDVLDKVCSLLPFFKDNSDIFSEAVNCLLALPNENFTNLCIKHYTTIHKRINYSLNKPEENLMILKVMAKLAKCYENGKSLLVEHFEDVNILLKLISFLFGTDKECRKVVIDIVMSITSRDVSFTTITTAHINSLKHGLNKDSYVKVMNNLFKSNDDDWAKVWCCVIRLLGVELHRGGPTYVNVLLEILEEAFKSPANSIRILAFQCWQELIYNFALDTLELCSRKRMKLLLIPLKANNCKVEKVAVEKFKTWWLLIKKIQQHIHMFIGDALTTFLNFCFLPLDFNLSTNKKEESLSHGKRFPAIAPYVVYALLELIGHKNPKCTCIQTDEDKLLKPLITTEIFVACSNIIINSVKEASTLLVTVPKFTDTQQRGIVQCLWSTLVRITDKSRKTISKDIISAATNLLDFYLSKEADHLASIILEEIILANGQLFLHTENKILFTQNMADKKKLIVSIQKESVLKNLFKVLYDISIFFNVEFLSTIEDHQLLCNFWTQLGSFLTTVDESKQSILFTDYLKTPVVLLVKNSSSPQDIITWCETYQKIFNDLTIPQEALIDLCIFLEHIQNENDAPTPANSVLIGQVLNFCIPKLKVMSIPNVCIEKILKILANLLPLQSDKNNCMVFNTLSKMLKMFYINYGVISQIFKALPSFLKTSVTAYDVNYYVDLLDILGTIDEIVTQVNTDNFLLNLILNSLKNIDKSSDKEISTLVTSLTKKCKQKLKNSASDHAQKDSDSDTNEKEALTVVKNTSTPINEKAPREEVLGHDIDTMTPIAKRSSFLNRLNIKNESKTNKNDKNDSEYFIVPSTWKFDPNKIPEKQKEKMKERGKDIPALYEDLSQSNSQEFFKSTKDSANSDIKDKENTTTKTNSDFTTELNLPVSNLIVPNESNKSSDKTEEQPVKKVPPVRIRRRGNRTRKNIPHVTGDSEFDNAMDIAPVVETSKSNVEITEVQVKKNVPEVTITKEPIDTTDLPTDNNQEANQTHEGLTEKKTPEDDVKEPKPENSKETEKHDKTSKTSEEVVSQAPQEKLPTPQDSQDQLPTPQDSQDQLPTPQDSQDQLPPSQDSQDQLPPSQDSQDQLLPSQDSQDQFPPSQDSQDQLPASQDSQLIASQSTQPVDSEQSPLQDSVKSQRGRIVTRRRSSPVPMTKTEREMKKLKIDCSINFSVEDADVEKSKRKLRSRKPSQVADIFEGMRSRRASTSSQSTTRSRKSRRISMDDGVTESEEVIGSSQESTTVSKIRISNKIIRTTSSSGSATYDLVPTETKEPSSQEIQENKVEEAKQSEAFETNEEPPSETMETEDIDVVNNTETVPKTAQEENMPPKDTEKNLNDENPIEKGTSPPQKTLPENDITIPSTAEALLLKDPQETQEKESIYEKDTESVTDDFRVSCETTDKPQDANTSFIEYKDTDNSIVAAGILSSPKKNEELTKEFLNNTVDISPIKVEEKQNTTALSTHSHESSSSESPDSSYKNNETANIANKSPEVLFSEEMAGNTDVVQNQQSSSESMMTLPKSPRKRLPRGRGRSAHLLELIPNVKPVDVLDSENAIQSLMMANDKPISDEPETKTNALDLLKFEKTLPSPLAKPSTGIIKGVKRKQPATPEASSDSPKSKRKRVSFHDPPVSSEKRYVPETAAIQTSKVRQLNFRKSQKSLVGLFKAKLLLSNKNANKKAEKTSSRKDSKTERTKEPENLGQTEPENMCTETDPKASLFTSPIRSEISDRTSPSHDQEPVPIAVPETIGTNQSETASNQRNPFYERLSTCQNSIDHIIYDLTSPLWISSLRETLKERGIKTIGDFASLSESEISNLPVKEDKIKNSKNVLDQYLQRLERENNVNLSVSFTHQNAPKEQDSCAKRRRRFSAPMLFESRAEIPLEAKVEQLEKIFGSSNPEEQSQLLRRLVSIIGHENSEILISAISDRLDYRHLIKDGNKDHFIEGALEYVGVNNALEKCLRYAVSVFGSDLTYWKCIEILRNITGTDFSIPDDAMEISLLNETQLCINDISPKIDLLCNQLSSLKKRVGVSTTTVTSDDDTDTHCDLTHVEETLRKLPRDKLFDLMKKICSD